MDNTANRADWTTYNINTAATGTNDVDSPAFPHFASNLTILYEEILPMEVVRLCVDENKLKGPPGLTYILGPRPLGLQNLRRDCDSNSRGRDLTPL